MSPEAPEKPVFDAAGVASALGRMADAMAAEFPGGAPLFLAGIPTRGVALAGRLASELSARGIECGCGAVDVSMYRDDLGLREGVTALRGTELPVDLERWTVVLVDDVQQTGRTGRAAIEAVLAFGRPRRICYAVLADRGGRELPVRPDFTGVEIPAGERARVQVRLAETDGGEEGIYVS